MNLERIENRNEYGDYLAQSISALVNQEPLVDRHKYLRPSLKVTSAAIAILSKLPFIPVAMQYGFFLGPLIAVSNTTTFSVLRYWAAKNMIDDILPPRTQAEIDLLRQNQHGTRSTIVKVVVIPVALLLAVASQTDTVLPAIIYNSGILKIAAAIVSLLGGVPLPLRSFQLALNHLSSNFQRSAECQVTAIKARMTRLLLENQQLLVTLPYQEKLEFVNSLERTSDNSSSLINSQEGYVFLLTQDRHLPPHSTQDVIERIFRYAGMGAGLVLAGVFEAVTTEYAYVETRKQLVDNPYIAATVATVAAGSTLYLFARSIVNTTTRIFATVGKTVALKETRNLGWQLKPKLSFTLTAIGLITGAFSAGIDLIIFGDFYKDNNLLEREFLRDTTTLAIFLLLFTATLDTIEDIVEHFIARGSTEERQILKLYLDFQKLIDLIQKSPSVELIGYLQNMSDDTLLNRLDICKTQLSELASQLGAHQG